MAPWASTFLSHSDLLFTLKPISQLPKAKDWFYNSTCKNTPPYSFKHSLKSIRHSQILQKGCNSNKHLCFIDYNSKYIYNEKNKPVGPAGNAYFVYNFLLG